MRKNQGITLIVLIITIIVMLILVALTIDVAIDGKLFDTAKDAVDKTNDKVGQTQNRVDELMSEMENIMSEEPPTDEVETYVGYYVDMDGDKEPDGIIFADLSVSKSGEWTNGNGTYSYQAIESTETEGYKEYYICKTNHTGPFGTRDVLTAKEGLGEDRFYVMALEDFNAGAYYSWYDAPYPDIMTEDYLTIFSLDFGTGMDNTLIMIERWDVAMDNADVIPEPVYDDLAGELKNGCSEGWFLPSRGEWAAFADNLEIMPSNYESYGLSDWYWSSSPIDLNNEWVADFSSGYMDSRPCYSQRTCTLENDFLILQESRKQRNTLFTNTSPSYC